MVVARDGPSDLLLVVTLNNVTFEQHHRSKFDRVGDISLIREEAGEFCRQSSLVVPKHFDLS